GTGAMAAVSTGADFFCAELSSAFFTSSRLGTFATACGRFSLFFESVAAPTGERETGWILPFATCHRVVARGWALAKGEFFSCSFGEEAIIRALFAEVKRGSRSA